MKFIKDNAYIFVGTLLVLTILLILINSIYTGYQHYIIKGEPNMYGLMYVSPDGEKEYLTNTNRGTVSSDISDIAQLAQKKTAEAQAKALLKNGWLSDIGGKIYIIQILKIAVNPEEVVVQEPKSGYAIEYKMLNDGVEYTNYYQGAQNKNYFSSYLFSSSKYSATRFQTESKALKVMKLFLNDLRTDEQTQNNRLKDYNRLYSHDFPTYTEYHDYIESTMKVIHLK